MSLVNFAWVSLCHTACNYQTSVQIELEIQTPVHCTAISVISKTRQQLKTFKTALQKEKEIINLLPELCRRLRSPFSFWPCPTFSSTVHAFPRSHHSPPNQNRAAWFLLFPLCSPFGPPFLLRWPVCVHLAAILSLELANWWRSRLRFFFRGFSCCCFLFLSLSPAAVLQVRLLGFFCASCCVVGEADELIWALVSAVIGSLGEVGAEEWSTGRDASVNLRWVLESAATASWFSSRVRHFFQKD
jgi:hypothetical protein